MPAWKRYVFASMSVFHKVWQRDGHFLPSVNVTSLKGRMWQDFTSFWGLGGSSPHNAIKSKFLLPLRCEGLTPPSSHYRHWWHWVTKSFLRCSLCEVVIYARWSELPFPLLFVVSSRAVIAQDTALARSVVSWNLPPFSRDTPYNYLGGVRENPRPS